MLTIELEPCGDKLYCITILKQTISLNNPGIRREELVAYCEYSRLERILENVLKVLKNSKRNNLNNIGQELS